MKSHLYLLLAATLFSTGGVAIKSASLTGWQVASFRSGVAALALLLLLPEARRRPDLRAIPVGLAYAATMLLFVLANKLTTSANSIFLQSTAPMYILLLGPWLLKERIGPRDLAVAATVALGLSMFFIGEERAVATAPDPITGNVLAATSGLSWALTVVGLRLLERGGDRNGSVTALLTGNVIVFLLGLPFAIPASLALGDLAIVLYLGIFQITVAYVCLTRGLREVPAFQAATVLLLEPALNPLWTGIFLGETPSAWAIAGGALILTATLVNTYLAARSSRSGKAFSNQPSAVSQLKAER
ncbi:MAG TPA: DMT family transporter [Bryobacteraceae bacterium]|nr:DMT family transporter [Bryobacteraceae bacterium]